MHFFLDLSIPLILVAFYKIYRRYTRISVANIPGPRPGSFILGNLGELLQGQAAEADFKWKEQFGGVVRFKALLGEDRLLISDPKALQYIFQTSGYYFPRSADIRELARMVTGSGILWAEGDVHRRHRKVMLPAFGISESKAFLPLFSAYVAQITEKWRDHIGATGDGSAVLDVASWLSRATLDAIGEAAFDYRFGALDQVDNELKTAYSSLMVDMFGSPSKIRIFIQEIWQWLPITAFKFFINYAPGGPFLRAHRTQRVARAVSKTLLDEKTDALSQGNGNRDVMSLLVRSNVSESENTKLNEEEIIAQMSTLILAGHETTSYSISWTLLELTRYPEIQSKLRAEIRATEAAIHARGETEFTTADFDAMPYTIAVIKESLRYNPVAPSSSREAVRNDVLPLSKPITTTTGEVIHQIPIPAGMKIITSIAGYNRDRSVFGPDADTFNPERWLDGSVQKTGTTVGVYANLLSFAGGVYGCIGWRFAVIQIQAFLVELINNFEFMLTEDAENIRRESVMVMIPTIAGQIDKGARLPLKVSIAARE